MLSMAKVLSKIFNADSATDQQSGSNLEQKDADFMHKV